MSKAKRTMNGCLTEQSASGQRSKTGARKMPVTFLCLAVMAPVIGAPTLPLGGDAQSIDRRKNQLAQAQSSTNQELGDAAGALSGPKASQGKTAGEAIIEALENPILRKAQVSVVAVDLNRGRTIFSYRPNALLNPASVVKLFTGAAALHYLKPEYRFESSVWLKKEELIGGVLNGDLHILGGGDPTLVSERLWLWVTELHHLGLDEIKGDLVIDESFFDARRIGPGFDMEDTDFAYMAPVGAMTVNFNAVGVHIRPGDKVGAAAVVSVEPDTPYVKLDAKVRTRKGSGQYLMVGSKAGAKGNRQELRVRGWIGINQSPKVIWRKIDHPPLYAGYTLRDMLLRRGIKVGGTVKVGLVPKGAERFHTFVSRRLSEVLDDLNKYSNNLVAELILKTIGAVVFKEPGSWENGIEAVQRFLKEEVGIAPDQYLMRNGSGLNDTNRFSAALVVRLLDYIYRSREIAYELIPSLGVSGATGTVRNRLTGDGVHHKVRAKTGTLTGVTALSGYIMSRDRVVVAFTVLVNGLTVSPRRANKAVDKIVEALSSMPLHGGPTTWEPKGHLAKSKGRK
ncbi:MAG: D-alanyl-D-alanine carboxypeptidase/D-alanyl-D-alanine-endopeptidase [Myxococcota bacterium]|nr:D-alanyl-D-alanine carboxypeptidase/D-alanyl-D-alanine-endopeptidase [Myxococcota bacterium]